MSLQHIKIESISENDLQRLVEDRIPEDRWIEYKKTLVYETPEQKQEFLSDISALANSDGGDLILGIDAERGVAKDLIGLRNLIPDDAQSKIENLLRDFIQPRILGVGIKAIPLASGKHALIVRVPRSFAAPHMVRHQGITRFCGRNSNGKYDLDVHELRSAFLTNETYAERLKSFRLDRINKLLSGSGPVNMAKDHLLVLHLLPVDGVRANFRLDSQEMERVHTKHMLRPIYSSGWGPVLNFDGLLVRSDCLRPQCQSYVQLTRSGFLEAVNCSIFDSLPSQSGGDPIKIIPYIGWERGILDVFPNYIKALLELGISLPYVLSISLLNVKDFWMWVGYGQCSPNAHSVDRNHLLTDEILIESESESPDVILRPLFDQVWNACGWHGSINYNAQGKWDPRP